jgi:tetratricopeptide (TPR) repeat protein
VEEALKLAEELIKIAPDDVDLQQQLALYYSAQQQQDKAIPLLENLAATQPKFRMQAIQGLVPLYFQSKKEEKAMALVDDILKENPSDLSVVYMMGSLMQNNAKFEKARAVYALAEKVDPRYRQNTLNSIAASYKQEGKQRKPSRLTKKFCSRRNRTLAGTFRIVARPDLCAHAHAGTGSQHVWRWPSAELPAKHHGYIDYGKSQALTELKQAAASGSGETNTWEDFEKLALSYNKAASQSERSQAWNAAKLLTAFYITEQKWDKAEQPLKNARDNGMEDVEWFNLSIYMAEQREQHDRMVALFDELQRIYPGRARDITIAKANTWVMARKYNEAANIIRQMNQERVPPGQITTAIQPLINAGEKKLARELLEQHLETPAATARLWRCWPTFIPRRTTSRKRSLSRTNHGSVKSTAA